MAKKNIKNKVARCLVDLESLVGDFNKEEGIAPEYSLECFRAGANVFLSLLMDAMWTQSRLEGYTFEESQVLAGECGKELRELVMKYTGIKPEEL